MANGRDYPTPFCPTAPFTMRNSIFFIQSDLTNRALFPYHNLSIRQSSVMRTSPPELLQRPFVLSRILARVYQEVGDRPESTFYPMTQSAETRINDVVTDRAVFCGGHRSVATE